MKLLLLQPPVQDFYDTDIRLQPIGLAYLQAAIKQHLPEVEVVLRDYHHGWGRKTIAVPKELAYLKEYYAHRDKSPFSTFHHYYHFGAGFDQIMRDIAEIKPDLIGISALFSPYFREALRIAKDIKSNFNWPILMGGSHVSAMPKRVLKEAAVDFIIAGEGERAIVEFLKAWMSGKKFDDVPGLGWKQDGKLIFNDRADNYPIEELPEPDLTGLHLNHYLYEKKSLSFVITSRSCPHRCTFCSVHNTFGFRYRRQSVAKVLAGIQDRYQQGVRVFDFEDDNLTYYKDEMKELCRGLIEMFPMKDVQFVAMNGISYLSLDRDLLQLMRQAGFTHLNLALVSSDITVRESTKRPHTIPKYLEVVHEAKRLGFQIVSYQILGLPSETLASMIQTLIFNARLPVLLGASMFYLTPNSPIAKNFPESSEEDIFKARLTAMAIETENFKREDVYTLFITTRILNYLKGLDVSSDVALEEAILIAKNAGGRLALGAEILDKLLAGKGMFAATSLGLKPVLKFKSELFFQVWSQLDFVATQSGNKVNLIHEPQITRHASQRTASAVFM